MNPLLCLALALALLLAPTHARADGAFPDEFQVLLPTGAPHTILLGTNFGLLRSDDDGASWTLVCESFIAGVQNVARYQLGADGALYAGFPDDVARSVDEGCTWSHAAGLEDTLVTDVFADPVDPNLVYAVGAREGVLTPSLGYVSQDAAAHFQPLLPPDAGVVLGIERARAAPRPLYVSTAVVEDDGGALPVIRRFEEDGGITALPQPGRVNRILGIAQIDPSDPGVGYFRDYALGRGDDVLELTRDGAATLAPMLSPGVQLSAFALADDGTRYSGSRAGMLWAAPPDAGFVQLASTHVRCLGTRGDTLYVCGDNQADGFALARSTDHGQTLVPLLRFQDVQGLVGCGQVPQACADAWRSFAGTFGIALQPDGGAATERAASSGCGCGSDASPLWAAFAVLAWAWRPHALRRR